MRIPGLKAAFVRGLPSRRVDVSSGLVKEKSNIWLPLVLMLAFAVTRWPGLLPLNFSAAYALAFCAGIYFPRRLAWWLPLVTMLATDILMNVLYYHVAPVSAYMLVNYAAYAAIIGIGRRFSARDSWIKLACGGLLGAILFYLVTNTAAWLQNPTYAKTIAGWIQALTTGVPGFPPTWMFFWKTLLSSGLFTGLFVGTMKLSEKLEAAEEKEEEPVEEPEDTAPEESKA
jgi:hypothetical protein